jgi:hypothetical protein
MRNIETKAETLKSEIEKFVQRIPGYAICVHLRHLRLKIPRPISAFQFF